MMDENKVLKCISGYENSHTFEPLGRGFLNFLKPVDGYANVAAKVNSPKRVKTESVEGASLINTNPSYDALTGENLYHVLGLEKIMFDATDAQLRYAHRKLLLLHHPDKTGKLDDPVFLNISKAFDTLSDPERRRGFDSQCDFDERIPSKNIKAENFYKAYGPVFKRNARFSETQPVPELGGPDAADDDVMAFYDFWFKFKSWREFTDEDEHDLTTAENREDKRWMESENRAARNKAKKAENRRLCDLVENANRTDPRVRRITETAKKERKAAAKMRKNQKFAAANAEKARKEQEKKLAEEAKVAAEKAKKDAVAAAKLAKIKDKKARRKIKKVFIAMWTDVDETDLKAMMDKKTTAELREMADRGSLDELTLAIVGDEVKAAQVVAEIKSSSGSDENNKLDDAKSTSKGEATKVVKENTPWNVDEDSMLAKGIKKFPGGTRKRWDRISEYVMSLGEGKCSFRSAKDCIKRWEESKQNISERKCSSADAFARFSEKTSENSNEELLPEGADKMPDGTIWTKEQQNALEAALKEFPATMSKKNRCRCSS